MNKEILDLLEMILKGDQEAIASIINTQINRLQIAADDWDNNHHGSNSSIYREYLEMELSTATGMIAVLKKHNHTTLADKLSIAVAYSAV